MEDVVNVEVVFFLPRIGWEREGGGGGGGEGRLTYKRVQNGFLFRMGENCGAVMRTREWKILSMLILFFAEDSMYWAGKVLHRASASFLLICRASSRSHLLPTTIIGTFVVSFTLEMNLLFEKKGEKKERQTKIKTQGWPYIGPLPPSY
eukprot:Phypoly_transcript_13734.p1 GENE.Phypoly_transcript_13734~~Phypoly_transcript_13734.p1  ORF type:complete len:149 (-),score=9.34 Phypoly_transcript_13734:385-831(-)